MPLTLRQQEIFTRFVEDPRLERSAGGFADLGVGRTTVSRELRKLVDAGLLEATGKAYRLNQTSDAFLQWDLSRAPHHRPAVRYDPYLLRQYQPGTTFLLSDEQRSVLERAGHVERVEQARDKGKSYDRVLQSLMIDLTHASSNLENVDISWLDTKTLIEFGERPEGLTQQQLRLVMNHKEAISFLKEHAAQLSFTQRDLFDLHTLLMQGVHGIAAGAMRTTIVKFDDSRYLPPDNSHVLREALELFCEKVSAIENPFEQAFFAMVFLSYIQPFQDGNKRMSRIAMNMPLFRHALAPFSFADVCRHDYTFGLLAFYERGRHTFLAEAFTAAYVKSAARYAELVTHVNEGGLLGTL